MGIERTRVLAGPDGCQHIVYDEDGVNGEKCLREINATVHRQNFGPTGENPNYHPYKDEAEIADESS